MILPIGNDTVLHEGAEEAPEIIETLEKAQSDALRGKVERMVDRARLEVVLAQAAQQRINAATQRIETKVSEAVGEWVCRVNLSVFLYNRNQHGNRCWRDPEFLRWFRKQEPGAFPHLHLRRWVNGWTRPTPNAEKLKAETLNVQPGKHGDPSAALGMTTLTGPEVVQ